MPAATVVVPASVNFAARDIARCRFCRMLEELFVLQRLGGDKDYPTTTSRAQHLPDKYTAISKRTATTEMVRFSEQVGEMATVLIRISRPKVQSEFRPCST